MATPQFGVKTADMRMDALRTLLLAFDAPWAIPNAAPPRPALSPNRVGRQTYAVQVILEFRPQDEAG